MPTYVIEHMEPDETDGTFPKWVHLEYSQMLKLASPSHVLFSSLSRQSVQTLSNQLVTNGANSDQFKTETASVIQLMKQHSIDLNRVCLLDPKAEKELEPQDAKEFDWFLFGGILGDDPPRDRTGELRKLGFPGRRLGPVQMTTDTALGVTKLIVQDGIPYDKIDFVDHPTIKFDDHESVEMPFRYVKDEQGEPILPPGMRQHLRDDMDKGFDAFE
ncbi:hypothetical protein OIO90_002294 [Microbotryomycetes sp. JL221]|nr:hypothetical protein OIO90_002294 [Microbotryomycetes sp. JL221]